MQEMIKSIIQDSIDTKKLILDSDEICGKIETAAKAIVETYKNGGKVILCGNGGSASDAQHIEAELVGCFEMERNGLPAIALTTNSSTLTSIANDLGYDSIFARQVETYGKEGDIFIGISTSGDSPSILQAFLSARNIGLKTIGLLGKNGGQCKDATDLAIVVPSENTARIQESHIMIGHILCMFVEKHLFGEPCDEE